MEIGVHHHWLFQAHLENHVKRWRTKASQSSASHLVCILFQATPVENELPPKAVHSQVFAVLFYTLTMKLCEHGSVQTIYVFLAYKCRVTDTISVKTLFWQSLGLLVLLHHPCSLSMVFLANILAKLLFD